MSITDTLSERIIDYTKELKLPGIRKSFKEESIDAGHNDISYEEFLNNLLEKEYELRLVNRKKRKIRIANFPYKKYTWLYINATCLWHGNIDTLLNTYEYLVVVYL